MQESKITSQKIENQISALTSEISRLKFKMDKVQTDQVLDLQEALEQKEFEKHDLERSITEELAAVLGQVNGKARTWTICADELISLAHEAEDLLEARGVRVKNRAKAMVRYRPAGKLSSRSQIGRSITTFVVMRRVHDGWRLVHAERDYCYVNQREFNETIVGPAAHEDMIRHATRNIRVWAQTSTETPPEGPIA